MFLLSLFFPLFLFFITLEVHFLNSSNLHY